MNINIKPEKLWDLLLKAEILECVPDVELNYIDRLYPVDLSDIEPECTKVLISNPALSGYSDTWDLSKEEVLGCTAVWDTETEEITITELNGEKCYLPPFRVYRSIKPEL